MDGAGEPAAALPPSDGEVVKRLFTSTPEKERLGDSPRKRDPLRRSPGDVWKYNKNPSESVAVVGGHGAKRKPRVGFCGAVIFLSLCFAAVALTIQFNTGEWYSITTQDVRRFFSNQPLQSARQRDDKGGFYFNGHRFLGLGALQLSLVLGVVCALFTCLFTFYDSNIPGNFPPTPVSPRRQNGYTASTTSTWHLSYIFVPVNCLVSFGLALFYLRWNLGLPLV